MNGKVSREKTEILLMEYAAGVLDAGSALIAASYIAMCPQARRYYRQCEELGGALMEHCCEPVAMSSSCIETVLQRIDKLECGTTVTKTVTHKVQTRVPQKQIPSEHLPAPVQNAMQRNQRARWRPSAPGIHVCNLPVHSHDQGHVYKTRLVRMAPGAKAMPHEHRGTELTLVLEGGYQDEFGRYKAGDLVILEDSVRHQPMAEKQGCTCLIATQIPVRFTGTFSWAINIFIR